MVNGSWPVEVEVFLRMHLNLGQHLLLIEVRLKSNILGGIGIEIASIYNKSTSTRQGKNWGKCERRFKKVKNLQEAVKSQPIILHQWCTKHPENRNWLAYRLCRTLSEIACKEKREWKWRTILEPLRIRRRRKIMKTTQRWRQVERGRRQVMRRRKLCDSSRIDAHTTWLGHIFEL